MAGFVYHVLYVAFFLAYTHGFTEPDIGEGVLHQIPPSLYKGGVIQLEHPDPMAEVSPSPFHDSRYTISTYKGWVTQLTIEKLQIFPFVDEIQFTAENSAPDTPIIINSKTKIDVFNFTDEKIVIRVEYRDFNPRTRKLRIRWTSSPPKTKIQSGYLNLDNVNQSISVCSHTPVHSVLLNLVEDGGEEWQAQTDDGLVTLKPGPQVLAATRVFSLQQLDPAVVPSDLLLEWFPYVEDHHIQHEREGCISYVDQVVPVTSWTLLSANSAINGSSLKIIFSNITSQAENYELRLKINGKLYMKSTHSIFWATYFIPVKSGDEVILQLVPSGTEDKFTLILCYEEVNATELYATGYLQSKDYPKWIFSGEAPTVQGFPLPPDWSVTFSLEELKIEMYRAWLDLVLLNGNSRPRILQSYTGTAVVDIQTEEDGVMDYNRYSSEYHTWQNYYTDFGIFGRNILDNEIVTRFQSVKSADTQPWAGYSIKWEIRQQREDEGKGTLYFVKDSGSISSPNYPEYYYSSTKTQYDISILNTSLYNGIELTFGDSYTEYNKDVISIWDHQAGRTPILVSIPPEIRSGNQTGQIFTYVSPRIVLQFKTSLDREFKGFTLDWKSVFVNESTITSTSTFAVTDTTTEKVTEIAESADLDTTFIGWVAGLGAAILILIVSLVASLAIIIQYRRQLSDVRSDGYYKPKFKASNLQASED